MLRPPQSFPLLLLLILLVLFTIIPLIVSSSSSIITSTTAPPISTLGDLHAHAHAQRTSSPLTTVLTPRQLQVLHHISHQSRLRHGHPHHADPAEILRSQFPILMPNRSESQRVLHFLLDSVPVVVHLRIQEVLPFLLKDSHYRNFYETNATNTMSTQRERLEWDARLFDGLYGKDNTAPHERIKFGLLDVGFAQNSDIIRKTIARLYGWSRLELKPSVRWRCTYSIGDSGIVKGTPNLTVLETLVTGQWRSQEMRPLVLAAAVAAGVGKDGEEDVKERVEKDRLEQRRRMKEGRGGILRWEKQSSVSYIEAQIHGPIDLGTDVEALIVDKYYQNNETMVSYLDAFTERFGVPYRWTEEEIGEIPYDSFGTSGRVSRRKF